MSAAGDSEAPSRRGAALTWFAVAGPPLAWVLQLSLGYGIEEAACSPGSGSSDLADASRPMTAVISAFGVAVAALAVIASVRELRAAQSGRVADPRGRIAFTSLAGLAGGVLFGALILLSVIALVALDACPT